MNKESILTQTEQHVRETLSGEGSGHDWWHVYRVWKNAINIAQHERVDVFIVELAALLHDIADFKLYGGDETVGPKVARLWLESQATDETAIEHVCEIIKEISFKGANVESRMTTKEGMVVQDADRLDAIGAIGIGRAFTYGGYKNRPMYDPDINPRLHNSFEEYKSNKSPTINHFYEKLLLLQDLMNTETARKIALKRHIFMENFLEQFFLEWDGKDTFD